MAPWMIIVIEQLASQYKLIVVDVSLLSYSCYSFSKNKTTYVFRYYQYKVKEGFRRISDISIKAKYIFYVFQFRKKNVSYDPLVYLF